MQDFRNLFVWQKSHKLALEVYAESGTLTARNRLVPPVPAGARGNLSAGKHRRGLRPGWRQGLPAVPPTLLGFRLRT